ncbi:MAG TPA: DUF6431 domain-containing protein [Lacunisphaera sp.]|nr:DUF6431 domain-containing protein [Lacunisphaera sp.]
MLLVAMPRSDQTISHAHVDVNAWKAGMPSVEEARPACCPRCEAASRPIDGPLGLIGHGMRTRQVRGPLEPNGEPTTLEVDVRRYRCSTCEAVITVLPRGLVPRRHFSSAAIGQALLRYGQMQQSQREVRKHTSPWRVVGEEAVTGWVTLRRWIAALASGALFAQVRAAPAAFTARQRAERAALTLVALAPARMAHLPLMEQVFAGAQTG